MSASLDRVLTHLEWLVACDTTNPPRRPEALIARLRAELEPRLSVEVTDHGDGCQSLLARRGEARVLFNVHVDTVPVSPGWSRNPHELHVDDTRAYGLGACDTKGAAAALLAAVEASDAPVALLFTTDEEAGTARCATSFLDRKLPFDLVVVSEPTECKAVLAHRGVATASLTFHGKSGHSSMGGSSANHALVRWAAQALAYVETREEVRFNIGRIEGGEKPNMISAQAEARFGVRPPPGVDPRAVLSELAALADEGTDFRHAFLGASLSATETARKIALSWGLALGAPVDFWTEAAIFATAYPALVYGPGNIAQAHAPDEFVDLSMLAEARDTYARIL